MDRVSGTDNSCKQKVAVTFADTFDIRIMYIMSNAHNAKKLPSGYRRWRLLSICSGGS